MRRLFKYLKPYWKAAILAPLLMCVEVAADLMQPTLMARIVDAGIGRGDIGFILRTGVTMIVVVLFGAVGGIGCTVYATRAALCFATDLRRDLFRKVQGFSFANLDRFAVSSLVTRLTNDVVQLQNLVLAMLRILVRSPLLCLGGIVMAVAINPRLSMILLVAVPVLLAGLLLLIRKGFPLFTEVQKRLDRVNAVMQENLSGIRVVKASVREEHEERRFAAANDSLRDATVAASRMLALTSPLSMAIMNASVVAVLWFGGTRVPSGGITVGQIMAFINYMVQILFSLMMVTFLLVGVSRAKASSDRVREVLETGIDILDPPGAARTAVAEGRVVFERVAFRYREAGGEPLLRGVSFSADPGETVAILGSTGSGKSSLVNLIPRFYDATEGRVLVGGRDVREYRLEDLRAAIGVVPQDPILFSGTVRENLRWGRADATDAEIEEAARSAQAHDFIMGFPQGYGTVLGQRGVNLSGGQRQRLAIARALVRRPRILILDDSTSAVDAGTESRIQKALRETLKETTRLLIAQRISSVIDADRIVILENGRVESTGTHRELLAKSPVYADICRSQTGAEASDV
jgi:ATP-binding cassette subfamily B multidrug efflux pump